MKQYITIFFISLLLLLVALQGCMEEPNAVGSQILPPSDLLQLDTVSTVALGNTTLEARPNASSPINILVGNADGYESWALLRFSSIPDTLLFAQLVGAEIQLRGGYHFGDSLASISFDVHHVLAPWGGDSLSIDSLQSPGFYDPVPSSSFQMNGLSDTAYISIPIDTTIVRQWITSVLDTAETNWGVLLKPTNASVIRGFATSLVSNTDWHPKLTTRFIQPDSTAEDTATIISSTASFTTFSSNPLPPNDGTRLYVQNGVALRGMVDVDISSLPTRATIHKAVLELTLDQQASRLNSHTRDSVAAYYVDSSGTVISIVAISEPAIVDGQKVYRLSVTSPVQLWTRNEDLNRFLITGFTESYTLDLFVFYGIQSSYPPKLTITYSPVQ